MTINTRQVTAIEIIHHGDSQRLCGLRGIGVALKKI